MELLARAPAIQLCVRGASLTHCSLECPERCGWLRPIRTDWTHIYPLVSRERVQPHSEIRNFSPGTVEFTDGSSRAFATRERPHLVFVDANRTTPVAVVTVCTEPKLDRCQNAF